MGKKSKQGKTKSHVIAGVDSRFYKKEGKNSEIHVTGQQKKKSYHNYVMPKRCKI